MQGLVRRVGRRPVRAGLTDRARVKRETWQNHWSWSSRPRRRRPSTNISGATTRSSRRWVTSAICRRASSAWTSTTTSPRRTSRSRRARRCIKELKDAAKDATDIYVATDPDREGEAIGWHLIQELKGKKRKFHRLTFNEITKKAVQEALKHPRAIDEKMVAAQRARRVLDRLVGYKISPLLWDKVRRGLSAGRVQSVALKLICDREREIEKFVPVEYWHVFARLAGPQPPEFEAKLLKKSGETITVAQRGPSRRRSSPTSSGAAWTVSSVATKERKRNAAPPFITSKLQQTARFPVKKTMMLAQQLYEGGIEIPGLTGGLITYMRTDSVRVADEAIVAVREHIKAAFGDDYLPEKPNVYKTKADAQDAHEAIRPTSLQHDPETVRQYLTPDQYSLYRLIWNRFVASQMPPATFDETTVDVTAGDYMFRVKGTVPKFAGWMATYGLTPGETGAEGAGPAAEQDDAPTTTTACPACCRRSPKAIASS